MGKTMHMKGGLWLRGRQWYGQYRHNGRTIRVCLHTTSRTEAAAKLRGFKVAASEGRHLPESGKVTFDALVAMLTADRAVKGCRSRLKLRHLTGAFGGWPAVKITTDRVRAYEAERLTAGAARATVNNELAALRRMFNLAVEARRITRDQAPTIHTPDPKNARQGFFEDDDFRAVVAALPDCLRGPMEFAYLTGWRVPSEVLTLTWRQVDFGAGTVRLEPNTTKNNEGRVFPFDALPGLGRLLREQRDRTRALEAVTGSVVERVFHRHGQPIRDYRAAWRAAIRQAAHIEKGGLTVVSRPQLIGRTPHDFRRTAVRNLERAGVPRSVATKLTGHKTESVYRRYAIVAERDLREGVAKLAALHATRTVDLRAQAMRAAGTG